MCAECHSTNLKKNYDPYSDTYQTTWSDIDVGCEACHGAGSWHVAWAELPAMARPQVENYQLIVRTSELDSRAAATSTKDAGARRRGALVRYGTSYSSTLGVVADISEVIVCASWVAVG